MHVPLELLRTRCTTTTTTTTESVKLLAPVYVHQFQVIASPGRCLPKPTKNPTSTGASCQKSRKLH